ncbi:hypothetical protein SAMN05421819_0279 [Bryocella elongata]|uniref:Uncharacterized protein n=1 Tax=Bryocella elongata TaxID=863522 RepID=A0A1H5SQA0_9BACT|nr:hypothetical protein [Bryocella elongata]SEF51937.1 hypothetical protein SAMN05421819_0279 [Bryocella elongata]
MLNAIQLDPDLPRQRRSVRSGIVYSVLAITAALFVVGRLPVLDALLASANTVMHSHNDQIVNAVLGVIPFGFVGVGSFGLVYKALGVLNKAGRSS